MEKEGNLQNYDNLEINTSKKNKNKKIIIIIALMIIIILLIILLLIYFLRTKTKIEISDNIEAVSLIEKAQAITIKLEKNLNLSEIAKIKFLFVNGGEHSYETQEISYSYKINANLVGLKNFKDIKEIYVVFTYLNGSISEIPSGTPSTGTGTNVSNASSRGTSSGGGGGGGDGGGNGGSGSCTPKTCADYSGQCGTGLSNGCSGSLDCSGNCRDGTYCYIGEGINNICINNSINCIDSDNGIDYYINSSVNISESIFEIDTCLDSFNLTEYYCYYNGSIFEARNESYECGYGCLGGKCELPSCTSDLNCIDLNNVCGTGICNLTTNICEINYNSSADICKTALGECDAVEYCSGSSSYCGNDLNKSDGSVCSLGECQEGVCVEEIQIPDSHFGMGGGLPLFAAELEEAGIEITREWIEWNLIEPEKDIYNWTKMDEKVQAANQSGIEILGYFAFMPIWARNMSNPKCSITQKDMLVDICQPLNWSDYTEFAKNVAERYDGTKYICGEQGNEFCGEMKYIGIFNEVQGFAIMNSTEYAPWLINGYQAIKQGNPNAQVLVGAVHSPLGGNVNGSGQDTVDFVDAMIRDYNQYYDIFDFHAYEFEDSHVGETIDYLKSRMNLYGVDKPLWLTETATFIATVKCNNLSWYDTESKGVIKRYAQALGNDVEKVFWYLFVALPTIEENSTGVECGEPTNFLKGGLGWVYPKGLGLPIDFHPRPTYYTYKLMTSKLGGFNDVENLSNEQYKFTFTDKAPVYVLWCNSTCSLPSEINGSVKVTDYLGNETIIDASEIVLNESPIFVEETNYTAEKFKETTYYLTMPSELGKIIDLNNDGLLDVIVLGEKAGGTKDAEGFVNLFYQNQDGQLILSENTYSIEHGADMINAGDVNNDSLNDIVITTDDVAANVTAFLIQNPLNTFSLSFEPAPDLPTSAGCAEIGDINGDGLNDVVRGNKPRGSISIYYQNNSNELKEPVEIFVNANTIRNRTSDGRIGDFNNDSKNDFAVRNGVLSNGNAFFTVFYNIGANKFNITNYDTGVTSGMGISDIRSADIDNNSLADIVVSVNEGNIGVYLQTNTNLIGSIYPSGLNSIRGIALGDINEDGKKDIVASSFNCNEGISILIQNKTGLFNTPIKISSPSGLGGMVEIGDVNNDGKNEIVTTNGLKLQTSNCPENYISVIEVNKDVLFINESGGITSLSPLKKQIILPLLVVIILIILIILIIALIITKTRKFKKIKRKKLKKLKFIL